MGSAAELTAQRWAERLIQEAAPVIDVLTEMTRLALGIASQALFSIDFSDAAERVGPAVRVAFEYLNFQMNAPIPIPVSIPTPREKPLTTWCMTSSGSANASTSILATCCPC